MRHLNKLLDRLNAAVRIDKGGVAGFEEWVNVSEVTLTFSLF